jgi:hypothetical protein
MANPVDAPEAGMNMVQATAPPQASAETNGTAKEHTTSPHADADDHTTSPANHDREASQNAEPKPGEKPPHSNSSGLKGKYQEQKQKVKDKTNPPGGFDATPIPSAPQGYTLKFTFHKALNLPVADIGTQRSDPFIHATLTTSLQKRHKEDPDLIFRTRTIRRTLEPEWEEEWVVANVPTSGFKLKCRLYDEDWPDKNDRLGNVTVEEHGIHEGWSGFSNREFEAKKRMGSKRAYFLKAITSAIDKNASMSPRLYMSIELIGKSDPPHGQMYTVGPTRYFRHFSPMIGRLAGIQVNQDEDKDHVDRNGQPSTSGEVTTGHEGKQDGHDSKAGRKTQKYDFQATEIQLQGPVPPKLYHRYVEFRPAIGMMFSSKGLRGRIMNKALRHQHDRIYNFDSSTEYGTFKACSEEASLQFLKMAHFDEGGRLFTYVLTLDGLLRFTETGKEFGIDLLSKHTMHSNVATYIACSGEFLIRRLKRPNASEDPDPDQPTHPAEEVSGGPPNAKPPPKPQYYQLVIDNDSGTYRPDKSVLPDLHAFLERNFPGLGIVTLGCDDNEDKEIKETQRKIKKTEGQNVRLVLNRSPSSSSFSSDDVSDLEDLENAGDGGRTSKKERMLDLMQEENPMQTIKDGLRKSKHGAGPSAA